MFSWIKSKTPSLRAGLEIRADGLALAIVDKARAEESLQVSRCAFVACPAAERAARLAELVGEYKLGGAAWHLVLPADQYQTYPVEKPKVDDAEVADAIRWKVKDMLDFDLENAVIDAYDFPEDALRGRPPLANVVVARKALIKGNVDLLLSSGLNLQSIDITDLSLRNIKVQAIAGDERPAALLYLRNGSGLMVLVKGDTLYLARHFDFSLAALNEPAQQESVMQQLGLEIQRSFDYFESQMAQVPPQKLVLAGPDPNVPLANMLGGAIGLKVEQFDWSSCYADEQIGLEHIQCLVAAGAAMRKVTG